MDPARGRFRAPAGSLEQDRVTLCPEESAHVRARRVGPGDRIVLIDGSGIEARGRIVNLDEDGAEVEILERAPAGTESSLECWLLQALPVKLPRMDDIVRQCTELGVTGIVPFLARRSQVPGGGREVLARKRDRWRRIARAATKQSGRVREPEIGAVATRLDTLPWDRLPRPLLVLEPGASAGPSLAAVEERPAGLTLVVGPEGGLSPSETAAFRDRGSVLLGLGPRILRADTAGAVALTVVQYLWGDLGPPSGK